MQLIDYGRNLKANEVHTSLDKVWEHLAEQLDLSAVTVKSWALNQRRVSAKHVIALEKTTDGLVLRYETRPDLYPVDGIKYAKGM